MSNIEGSILIVDDNITMIYILDEHLTNEGYIVEACQTTKCAVEISKEIAFDLFIIDYSIDNIMTGDLLAVELEAIQPTAKFIILTGKLFVDKFKKWDAAMSKPVRKKKLLINVRKVLCE